jgi:hypothetical protein
MQKNQTASNQARNLIEGKNRYSSGRLVRFLVGSFLHFHLSSGLVNLALEFITGTLELTETLADATRKFGKFFCPEKQQDDHENKNDFGPTRHGKGEQWSVHS